MKTMYKIICAVLAVVFCCGLLSGCSNVSDTASNSDPVSSEPAGAADYINAADTIVDYSKYLDERGMYAGITALDYVTLPDWNELHFPEEVATVSDEVMQDRIDQVLSSFATYNQITDRAVQDGDTLNIDYVGMVDGEPLEQGTTNGAGTFVTIGVTDYIDDFLEQLIGHKPGETFDIEVTFPETYTANPDLVNKDAVFTVTINYIQETVLPELTDAFVAEKLTEEYGYKDKQDVLDSITDMVLQEQKENYVAEWLNENAEVTEVPEAVVEFERVLVTQNFAQQAEQYGMNKDAYAALGGYADFNDYMAGYEESFAATARYSLIIQAVLEQENISITEEDIATYTGITDRSAYIERMGETVEYYMRWFCVPYRVRDFMFEKGE